MPCQSVVGVFPNLLDFGGTRIGMVSAGIGAKAEIAERTGNYRTLGWDLAAIVVDELVAKGFESTNIAHMLDVDRLDL